MSTQTPPKPTPAQPQKEEVPQRNLPGVVNDPNRPTDPSHREFERQPGPPEFDHNQTPVEIEQPRDGAPQGPKGLV
jgi:hypothetical protein